MYFKDGKAYDSIGLIIFFINKIEGIKLIFLSKKFLNYIKFTKRIKLYLIIFNNIEK